LRVFYRTLFCISAIALAFLSFGSLGCILGDPIPNLPPAVAAEGDRNRMLLGLVWFGSLGATCLYKWLLGREESRPSKQPAAPEDSSTRVFYRVFRGISVLALIYFTIICCSGAPGDRSTPLTHPEVVQRQADDARVFSVAGSAWLGSLGSILACSWLLGREDKREIYTGGYSGSPSS